MLQKFQTSARYLYWGPKYNVMWCDRSPSLKLMELLLRPCNLFHGGINYAMRIPVMLFSNAVGLCRRNAVLIVLLCLGQYCSRGINLSISLCECGLVLLEMLFEMLISTFSLVALVLYVGRRGNWLAGCPGLVGTGSGYAAVHEIGMLGSGW